MGDPPLIFAHISKKNMQTIKKIFSLLVMMTRRRSSLLAISSSLLSVGAREELQELFCNCVVADKSGVFCRHSR